MRKLYKKILLLDNFKRLNMNEMHDQYIYRDIMATKVCLLKIGPSTMEYQLLNVFSIKVLNKLRGKYIS